MLYIIGLGLNEKGMSVQAIEAIEKSKKIYLETYTVDFPYTINKLEKIIKKKIIKVDRKIVESDFLIKEAKKQDIALLVYGSPLFATTHSTLIMDCKKQKIKTKIIYSASVFDAISETGLQLYKFGKISSMPAWKKNYEPVSFLDYVIENQKINAHSLILVDIGLEFNKAVKQLEIACNKKNIKINKLIVCSNLGTNKSKIFYNTISNLKNKKITNPFCFIIPGKMHFLEQEIIEEYMI